MMNKKIVALTLAAGLTSSVLMFSMSVFAADPAVAPDPVTASTPVTADLTINQKPSNPAIPAPSNPTTPTIPDKNNPGNVDANPQGLYGIAYYPSAFNFSGELNDNSTQQEFVATGSKQNRFNLGVKDKTRENKGWDVKAQLTGSVASIPGASLNIAGNSSVKVNNNGTLEADPTNAVTGATNVTVNGTQNTVMTANDQYHNSTYDYSLGIVKLVITNPSQVSAGNYTGNVVWTLTTAP